ncbi:MAG: type 2 isopentenyl-diphosphate Delta-isomerase [Sandaracinaceae bacterium]|nr:type 2 isopentenyl-diphosphate Delta-isomerase [Sandaracinaceae bacterium]
MSVLSSRKADHLELCASDAVAYRGTGTLLDCVRLPHESLPDLHLEQLDLRCPLLGKTLRAPLVIAGMTGGHPDARAINRDLASVAEELGYGFGLGSQRAMEREPALAATYQVRDVAPTALLLGNLGVIQARDLPTERIAALLDTVGADALCAHMSPAMELIQRDGDRDFRGGLDTFARLVSELRVPIVAKETGNGIGQACARRLSDLGVLHADTSGAGGTSWVGVETLRADGERQALGETLWDWGTPTAASVHYCVAAGLVTIATGGIKSGLDVARALVLGATAAGIARPVYQAWTRAGRDGALAFMRGVEAELRAVMLLTGCGSLSELRALTPMIVGELRDYMRAEPAPHAAPRRALRREVRA